MHMPREHFYVTFNIVHTFINQVEHQGCCLNTEMGTIKQFLSNRPILSKLCGQELLSSMKSRDYDLGQYPNILKHNVALLNENVFNVLHPAATIHFHSEDCETNYII